MLRLGTRPERGTGRRIEPEVDGRNEATASAKAARAVDPSRRAGASRTRRMTGEGASSDVTEIGGRRRLQAGDRLGTYEITEFLAGGVDGDSYLASSRVGEPVVVKYGDARALAREAEALRHCSHPNLVALREVFEDAGGTVLVLAHEPGQRLDQWLVLSERRQSETSLRPILSGLLEALEAVHGAGYLHRDIAPRNILIRPSGAPLLLDLGAARRQDEISVDNDPTSDATPGFAPIEQYLSSGDEGPWTDLYALAAVIYFALTGSAPPDAHARARGAALAPAAMGAEEAGSEGFFEALDWALAELAGDRPQSIAAWRVALFDEQPKEATPVGRDDWPEGRIEDPADLRPPPDDVPATQRVLRVPGRGGARLSAPSDLRGAPANAAGRGRRSARWGLLLVLLLAGAAGGAWAGWDYYLTHIKAEWVVDAAGAGDVSAIGDALAKAKPGAVVRIAPGTYSETLRIERPVSLLPLDPDATAPMIAPESGACLTAGVEAGTVRGLAFSGGDGSSACIAVESGSLVLDGNVFQAWDGTAIRVARDSTAQITGNQVIDASDMGMVVEPGGWAEIRDNVITGSGGPGLVVRSGTDPVVEGNRIENSGKAGLLIAAGSKGRYSDNQIVGSRGSGIEVRDASAPIVLKSRIEASGQAGLFLYDGAGGEYRENSVIGNGFSGVVLARGATPVLAENTLRGNSEHGVLVLDDAGGRLAGNKITENKGHGIALGPESKAVLADNELQNNRAPQVMKARMQRP